VGGTPVTVTKWTAVALLLAAACAGYGGYDYVQQSAAVEDAVAVDATVVETDIQRDSGGRRSGPTYDVAVEYTYRYEGTEYTGDQVYPGSITPNYDSRSEAESVLAPYEEDATVTAYVDPAAPGEAFLERQATSAPLTFVAGGSLVFVLVALNAVGARNPGQETGVELEDDQDTPWSDGSEDGGSGDSSSTSSNTSDGTLLGVDRGSVNTASKRLMALGPALAFLSVIALVVVLLGAGGGAEGASPTLQPGPTDPAGLAVLGLVAGLSALVVGLVLYAGWSFTEYRRVRERVPEPRPPSPFRRLTRLVTILGTDDDDLDPYGWRVKRTGFALAVLAIVGAALAEMLVF